MFNDDVGMKKRVEDVLTESGYHDARAAKMDVNDLLKYVCPLKPIFLLPARSISKIPDLLKDFLASRVILLSFSKLHNFGL